ncbi:translation initiation factor IF-2-like [Lolium rigidum]|uniref:translation initiation factor IF-2-like n=1 Tax=Lolium rigidum TaxID=89674 RepID=UPI001F5E09B2|nr:translation initiation factor IF-2-like [Lolium rigidum]
MPRLAPGLGFPAPAAAADADPATAERRHPASRRKKPPPRRRRPAPPPTPAVGPRGAADPDPGLLHHLRLNHGSLASRGTSTATSPRGEDGGDDEEEQGGYGAAAEADGDSFSNSLRECQKQLQRRAEGAAPPRPPATHEPNADAFGGIELLVLSPRCLLGATVGGMSKSSTASSRSRSGTFPSPGTPNYSRHCAAGNINMQYPKGWSSERVPQGNRRHGGSGVVLPFNNGRKLPSKWEDAEKWILSPVSCDGMGRMSAPAPHHRRPKSKSGPLGHPAGAPGAYASVSPMIPCFDGVLAAASFAAHSPFSAGVLMPDHVRNGDFSSGRGRCGDDGSSRSYSAEKEPYIWRSASTHAWTETLMEASAFANISEEAAQVADDSLQSPQGETSLISSPIIKKDVATQMSPDDSIISSSPKARHSCSSLPSGHAIREPNNHTPKVEVRDVEVDDQVTVTRWSKRHITRGSDKRSTNIVEWRKKTTEPRAPSFDEKERESCISKCKREEAKITAWENLQKAKAEAAIRKLEMKLEKKRSSSMDRILGKLRSAQKKAQDMRTTVSVSEDQCGEDRCAVRATKKASYLSRTGKPFSCCFTYQAC